jgi:hypothetical protein
MAIHQSYYVVWTGGGDVDWDFNPRFRGRCELPMVLCSQCMMQYSNDAFSAVPEDVPITVRKVLRKFKPTDLVSPSKFAELERLVRRAYGFPPERRIQPGTSLGPLYLFRERFEPAWQVYHSWSVDRVFVTEPARQRLARLNIPNLCWFPLFNKEEQPTDLWQMVVLGKDIVPETDGGLWWQCAECGHWQLDLAGQASVGFQVPEGITDDFVFLEVVGLVVSERVVETFQALGEKAVWGLEFIPLSQWRKRKLTPADIEELEKSFEELAGTIRPPDFA